MKLLHIDSSITGDASASRAISAAVVERLRATHPGLEVTHRDLVAQPLAHLTLDAFGAEDSQAALEEFIAADIVVIGTGFYNFTIPSQLKAWFDRVLVAGKTFRYGPNGAEGLAGSKRVIIALARGGVYSAGSPGEAFEHAETLLRVMFGFIGVTDVEFVIAEGLNLGEEPKRAALDGAISAAGEIGPKELVQA